MDEGIQAGVRLAPFSLVDLTLGRRGAVAGRRMPIALFMEAVVGAASQAAASSTLTVLSMAAVHRNSNKVGRLSSGGRKYRPPVARLCPSRLVRGVCPLAVFTLALLAVGA